jgi:hypothetical protein
MQTGRVSTKEELILLVVESVIFLSLLIPDDLEIPAYEGLNLHYFLDLENGD